MTDRRASARHGSSPSTSFTRWGGLAGVIGGLLWAVTPLREPLLGGRFPEHPVFRPYNFVLLIIAVLLALGLSALRARYKGSYGRSGALGHFVVLVGYAMLFLGSAPAVVLSSEDSRSLIMGGQDLGFLGALMAGLGAIPLGIALWRARAASRVGAMLLILALPVGLAGVMLISAMGFEDVAGLPLTVLYGVAWVVLGSRLWTQAGEAVE